MKLRHVICFLSLLLLPAVYAEGLNFKGVPLGISLAEFTEKHGTERNSAYPKPILDFGTVFTEKMLTVKETKDFRKSGCIVARLGDTAVEGKKLVLTSTIAGVEAFITYAFFAENLNDWDKASQPYFANALQAEKANSRNAGYKEMMAALKSAKQSWANWNNEQREAAKNIRLGQITITFKASEFSTVSAALTEKFGKPTETTSAIYHNLAGAQLEGTTLIWQVGEDKLCAKQFGSKLDQSEVDYIRPALVKVSNTVAKQAGAKVGAEDL